MYLINQTYIKRRKKMNAKEKMNPNKTAGTPDISLRRVAIVAGIGFLMSFVGAMYASYPRIGLISADLALR